MTRKTRDGEGATNKSPEHGVGPQLGLSDDEGNGGGHNHHQRTSQRTPDDERCITSANGTCKVMLTSQADMAVTGSSRGRGFASLSMSEVTIYSCYFSPNVTLEEYSRLLNGLESDVRNRQTAVPTIIAGDFNAKAQEWGSNRKDRRGEMLLEMAASLGLTVENVGTSATYRGPRGESVVDVTFLRAARPWVVRDWTAHQDLFTDSDHVYISYRLLNGPEDTAGPRDTTGRTWAVRKLDEEKLLGSLRRAKAERSRNWMGDDPDEAAERFRQYVASACDASMPRGPGRPGQRSMY